MDVPTDSINLWYSDIDQKVPAMVVRLSKQGFPYATRMVLSWLQRYFKHCENFPPGKFPNKDHVMFLMDSFVFFKTNQVQIQLTPSRELQVLEEICKFFQHLSQPKTRLLLFEALFGTGNNPNTAADVHRRNILHKLVSLAVSIDCGSILECAAFWIHNQTQPVFAIGLVDGLLKDFCELVPKSVSSLRNLSTICPTLSNQMIGVAFYACNTKGAKDESPHQSILQLLDIATDWITEDQTLILCQLSNPFPEISSFRKSVPSDQVPKKFEVNTLLNIIQYCILYPLRSSHSENGKSSGGIPENLLVSKLFFATMQSVLIAQNFIGSDHSSSLISVGDIAKIVSELKRKMIKYDERGLEVEVSIDRLAEAVQILSTSGCMDLQADDLLELCKDLPQNGLLGIVLEESQKM